ncbi:MAG: sugar nucleotide-binding protein [Verrucomicrobia bacterium]|nr:sugar nucleotide-binding protein [Verrucomicrobiota bacterium]MBU1735441.1 sugar nucleotide-binding protein [Verrucomicrobiota bacterium]MBU1856836.1 sugar nucleotide-binding protein [Verrucomicrobiota bacterium]
MMPPEIIVLGGKGFVGAAIVAEASRQGRDVIAVDLVEYQARVGAACRVLINANGNSRKYLADKDPKLEFDASVQSVFHALHDFRFDHYVQLSTIDVYADKGNPALNSEQAPIDPLCLSRYGHHKWLAEELVRFNARSWLIVRMGGFVGPGLKKNSIYDILKGLPLRVHPDSCYQYQHNADLARIVLELVDRQVFNEIFNVAGEGVISLCEVAAMVPGYDLSQFLPGAVIERCDVNIGKIQKICPVSQTCATVSAFIKQVLTGKEVLA